jgi:serine/threonine protein kinase
MTGTEIGNYRILEKLGEGGMGVVYKAVDTSLDRIVAIKVLNGDLSRVPELVFRFRGEAKAQANLNHTNLATLYAFLTVGDNAMMVMEFVDGETFAQMIRRRGPLPAQGSVPMFRQALLGFGYAHRAGIIHRDIKPSNLMLNHQGIVKVMDFGIAKVVGERGLTRTGMQVGTCRYMSPEQVLNREADIRSDIYALGITLYEMLTANTPFQSDSEFQIMSDHVHTPPPPPTRFYPYIPKGVENAILKALAKNSDERFQTVEEFGAALERPDDFGVVAPVVVAPPPLPPPPVPGQTAWPRTATMPAAAAGVPPPPSQYRTPGPLPDQTVPLQYQTPAPSYQTPGPQYPPAPGPPYQTLPPQHQTPPPPYQTPPPPYQTPGPAPQPAAGLAALFTTWPGRIVVAGAAALVLVMLVGAWFLLKPAPPRPLPTPITAQLTPSQAISSTPSAQRVDIEMSNPPAPALQVQAFEASPNPVRPGQRVTLSWSVPGATEVTISPSIGTVPAQGSKVVSPRADVQFTLMARAANGQTVSRTVNLLVDSGNTSRPAPAQETHVTRAQPPPSAPPQQPAQAPEQTTPPPREQYQPAPVPPAPQPQTPPQQGRASPLMNLYHDHGVLNGNKYVWPSCWGQLQIGGGKVVYHVLGTSDGRRDDFVVPVSAVEEVRVNRIPIRGRPAFHMRINGQIFNFVPASGAPVLFVNVIEQWLQAK